MSRLDDAITYLDVKDWVSQFVEVKDASQGNFKIQDCPKCFNTNWKLYVHNDKKRWYCQVCQWGMGIGDVCVLLAEVSGIHINDVKIQLTQSVVPADGDDSYLEKFIDKLYPKTHIDTMTLKSIDIPGTASFSGVNGGKVYDYAKSRGLSLDLIEEHQLLWSPKLRNVFGPWLVFPVNYFGVKVAYQGRCVNPYKSPKYLSADTIDSWIWPIRPDDVAKYKQDKSIVLVEGVFDALGFRKAGIQASCTFGKSLKRKQAKLLRSMGIDTLYFAYDPGTWGSIKTQIKEYGYAFHIFILDMNFKGDPGDVLAGTVSMDNLQDAYENAIDTRGEDFLSYSLRKDFA